MYVRNGAEKRCEYNYPSFARTMMPRRSFIRC